MWGVSASIAPAMAIQLRISEVPETSSAWGISPISRMMSVEILAAGRQFPAAHVERVFARNHIRFEPREISQSDDVTVKYQTWLDPRASLEDLSVQLMADGERVKSVAWEHAKRERA